MRGCTSRMKKAGPFMTKGPAWMHQTRCRITLGLGGPVNPTCADSRQPGAFAPRPAIKRISWLLEHGNEAVAAGMAHEGTRIFVLQGGGILVPIGDEGRLRPGD